MAADASPATLNLSRNARGTAPVATLSLLDDSFDDAASPELLPMTPVGMGMGGLASPGTPVTLSPATPATGEAPAPHGLPAGTGPLYKCALCEALVYESQLEHHVLVCPDPNGEAPPSPGAQASPEAAQHHRDTGVAAQMPSTADHSKAAKTDTANQVLTPRGGRVATPQPAASGGRPANANEYDDEKSIASGNRASLRRKQVADEMRRKEDEECTFKPKTLNRGSPKALALVRDPDAQRTEQRMKSQRLMRVEAQVYADVTHRPKVSRFAQVWSQRQHQALASESLTAPSVFERLYATAMQSRIAADSRDAIDGNFSEMEGTSIGSKQGSVSSRKVSTSELLYNDALDRRERLRTLADRQSEEAARDKCQVLGRSRRYYWQMLERQVKAAYEAASSGSRCLPAASLENFLVEFGCLPPVQSGGATSAVDDDERRGLCAALWRHLDPQKSGQVDVLTLTVFFHVLMGAVDEAAKASQGISPGVAADASGAAPRNGNASNAAALSAISEDKETAHAASRQDAPASGAGADDEGRRIVELLVRFDPAKLRAEFKTLYMQRMYNQSRQGSSAVDKNHSEVVAPEIDERSRHMAERVVERERQEADEDLTSHADVMLWRHKQVEAKKEELREKAKKDETKGCTFRPQTRAFRADGQQADPAPGGQARTDSLYTRAAADRERKALQAQETAKARSAAEAAECTFRPNTARSGKSYQSRVQDVTNSGPAPRGFYESRTRLRAAGEADRKKREQRDDRMARIEPAAAPDGFASQVADLAPSLLGATAVSLAAPGDALVAPVSSLLPTVAEVPAVAARSPRRQQASATQERRTTPGAKRRESPHATGSQPPRRAAASSSKGPTPQQSSPRGGAPLSSRGSARARSQPRDVPATMHESQAAAKDAPTSAQRRTEELATLGSTEAPASHFTSDSMAKGAAGGEAAPAPTESHSDALMGNNEGEPAPVLFVDVNIAPGQPLERIVLREGESVTEVAAEFAARHVLTPALAQRLHSMLSEVLHRQQQLQQQQQQQPAQ